MKSGLDHLADLLTSAIAACSGQPKQHSIESTRRHATRDINQGFRNAPFAAARRGPVVSASKAKRPSEETLETPRPAKRSASAAFCTVSSKKAEHEPDNEAVEDADPSLDEECLVPPHPAPRNPSQHVLKKLRPSQIVNQSRGSHFEVVIPPDDISTPEHARKARADLREKFARVLLDGEHVRGPEREQRLASKLKPHEIERDGGIGHTFSITVAHFAERDQLRLPLEKRVVEAMWKADAGLNVQVCGYSSRKTALIKFKHIPFVDLFQAHPDGCILNDEVKFPNTKNPARLVDPFLDELSKSRGCKVGSLEVLMKYYRAESTAKLVTRSLPRAIKGTTVTAIPLRSALIVSGTADFPEPVFDTRYIKRFSSKAPWYIART